jgi:hypothetical protein
MTMPPSFRQRPATECPPERTVTSRPDCRQKSSTAATSWGEWQRTTAAGSFSIIALKSVQASS